MPYITINEAKLYYEASGSGPDLLYLHGLFLDTGCYKPFLGFLSSSFRVYSLDLPCHGRSSDVHDPFSMADMVSLIDGFVHRLGLKPVVFAHSAGALIAMHYASGNKRVMCLVLSSPPSSDTIGPGFLFRLFIIHPILSFFESPLRALIMFSGAARNLLRTVKVYPKMLTGCVSDDVLKKISAKTIIIWPRYDVLCPQSDRLKLIKSTRSFVIPTTHEWPVVRPELVKGIIGEIK